MRPGVVPPTAVRLSPRAAPQNSKLSAFPWALRLGSGIFFKLCDYLRDFNPAPSHQRERNMGFPLSWGSHKVDPCLAVLAPEASKRFLGDVWIDLGEDGVDDAGCSIIASLHCSWHVFWFFSFLVLFIFTGVCKKQSVLLPCQE